MNVIITWKDVILLQWDGNFPRNVPPELAPTKWQYLNGIAHWSKKTQKFILALSSGNIDRIFKQFGNDNVMYDPRSRQLAETFMRASREFNEMCKQADSIKKLPLDQLPQYDYKVPPLAEYQHRGVVLLTNIPRVPLFADCGCLAGDTKIKFNRGGITREITIAKLFEKTLSPRINPKIKTMVRSFKGELIGLNEAIRVVESGIKYVYKLTLKDGKVLKATKDHEILTRDGFIQLGDLKEGDLVMVDNLKRHKKKKYRDKCKKFNDARVAVGSCHPFARKQPCHGGKSFSFLIEKHRLIWEAHNVNMSIEEFVSKTYNGFGEVSPTFINPKTHCIHHKNNDHYDNRYENMAVLTHKEHARLHSKGYSNFSHGIPEYSEVESISFVGDEMTYDIVCAHPHRNFVANGIVVHNCGKTYMVLTSTENHIKSGKINKGKTLICAKLATLESGWLEDTKKFTDLNLKCLWLPTSTRNRKEKLAAILQEECDAYLINHDGLFVLEKELTEKKFQKVVVDESTILKGFHGTHGGIRTGKFGKALLNISQFAHWRVVMTGTPAPNGPEDLWGQMHFLDPRGNLLERQFNEFRQLYFDCKQFRVQGRVVKKWEPLPTTLDRVNKVLEPLMYRLRIRDHLDLPQLITMKRFITMDKGQTKHYSDLKNYLSTVVDDERILTPVKVTQLMKLRQVTGGFLIDHKEEAHSLPSNPKIEELDSILEEEIGPREKVVIYAQYQYEIKLIESRYKKFGSVSVFGGNTAEQNLSNIKKFIEDRNTRIIVLHPRSAAHGVTFTVSHYMVFYSLSYSEEEHYQCVKRIERAGQKSTMVVFYLLCKGSIDGIIYDVLQIKAKDQKKLIDVDNVFIEKWRTQNGTQ